MAAAGPLLARAHRHPALSPARLAGVALATAALATGCGAGSRHASTLDRGRAIYRRACTDCHTLDGREHGTDGGDLVLGHLGVGDLASFARTMPVSPRLDAGDAHAVAVYIHAVAARLSSSPH